MASGAALNRTDAFYPPALFRFRSFQESPRSMITLLQNRNHRKVIGATEGDLERLTALRTLVEREPLFAQHAVHEAELIRAALAVAVSHLDSETSGTELIPLKTLVLRHIASEREQSQQVHALKMQEAWKRQQIQRRTRVAGSKSQ